MKLTILALATLSLSAFAQRAEEIKVDVFGRINNDHSIHAVEKVEVLSKTEGNLECLYGDPCEHWATLDVIKLKVSGQGEANFGGHNKVYLREETLEDDYRSNRTITRLSLQGITQNEESTLVYDNVAWAQWGGSIPFEFKLEIHNDMNNDQEEREFRIPVSDGTIYRFRVKYADAKWAVEELPALSNTMLLPSRLANEVFNLASESEEESFAQATLNCLRPEKIEIPACFVSSWRKSERVSEQLASELYEAARSSLEVFGESVSIGISCQKPTEWNPIPETQCTLSIEK